MSSVTIKLQGLEQVRKEIRDVPKNAQKRIGNEMKAFGEDVVRDAKNLAPTDEGALRNAISYVPKFSDKSLDIEIVVAVDYASYVEFGTKGFAAKYVAQLPTEWKEFAAQFKGKGGGTFAELIKRITEWVMRKGFAAEQTKSGNRSKSKSSIAAQRQAAYAIALRIARNGIQPHPYLYPAVEKNKVLLINRLNSAFK